MHAYEHRAIAAVAIQSVVCAHGKPGALIQDRHTHTPQTEGTKNPCIKVLIRTWGVALMRLCCSQLVCLYEKYPASESEYMYCVRSEYIITRTHTRERTRTADNFFYIHDISIIILSKMIHTLGCWRQSKASAKPCAMCDESLSCSRLFDEKTRRRRRTLSAQRAEPACVRQARLL